LLKSKIKICGIRDIDTLDCCIQNKVDFFGLIFYTKSSRNIELENALNLIKHSKNIPISSVGVFFNEKIDEIKNLLRQIDLNYIQLHGEEDFNYIKELKKNFSIKIIKNIPISNKEDFLKTKDFNNADMFLFDYKPKKNELPGGNAKKFSWELLKDIKLDKPWFISGGINIDNIKIINEYTIPYGIDISSGVEVKPGIKNNEKIISLMKLHEL
jgi:phosphoribosylanthranilate isomerase